MKRILMKTWRLWVGVCLGMGWATVTAAAELRVATLHPVLTDLATEVGGDAVRVTGLLKPGDDPHDFSPSATDLREMSQSTLILASGKGLEPYLDKLRDSLKGGQRILEVGEKIPSLVIGEDEKLFVCCPHHIHGSVDPHWWHSVKNMQRAADLVADAFGEADEANEKAYAARAKVYQKRLDDLARWARREIAKIPRSQRKLATAHAAYTYFCEEFGFMSMPVQGLDKEREATSQYLADVITDLKAYEIKTVFPEVHANPKVLREMVRHAGARIGGTLFADFTGSDQLTTYEAMFRHNVETIVAGFVSQ